MIPRDDDGIVVVMSDIRKTVTREEFDRELVRALDDLVDTARHHGKEIQASLTRTDVVCQRRRTEDAERARNAAVNSVVRETPPGYGNSADRLDRVEQRLDRMDQRLERMDQRLERMDRTLTDINERMATKVELEATRDKITRVADGDQHIGQRLDAVADLLKPRFNFS